MRKGSVLSLIYGVSAQMAAVNFIQQTVYALEDNECAAERIAGRLRGACAELEAAKDDLCEYLTPNAEE